MVCRPPSARFRLGWLASHTSRAGGQSTQDPISESNVARLKLCLRKAEVHGLPSFREGMPSRTWLDARVYRLEHLSTLPVLEHSSSTGSLGSLRECSTATLTKIRAEARARAAPSEVLNRDLGSGPPRKARSSSTGSGVSVTPPRASQVLNDLVL